MNALLSPSQVDTLIQESIAPLPTERAFFQQAIHRTLRSPLLSDRPFPPFDRVTMDGIACRFQDLALGPLQIQGLHPAGNPIPDPISPNHCWQIMTGAVLPPDCDCIIPVEELAITGTTVTLLPDAQPTVHQFIHRQGSDCPTGTELLSPGTRLNASHLGLAATIGATELTVTRLPHISILTTGDELVPPSEVPLPHQLRQSNGPALLAACQGHTTTHQHLPDNLEQISQALSAALTSCDLIILSGGISKGKKDYIRPALEALIGPPTFHGVAQRPGKPLAYWKASAKNPPLFALPGNPNSTLTTFLRYVRPALALLAGHPPTTATTLPLAAPLSPHPKLTLFLPAILLPSGQVRTLTPQNSGDFAATLSATGFIEVAPGSEDVTKADYFSH